MWAWIVKKWASKAVSNILVSALAAVLISGVWYVQGLRLKVAKCKNAAIAAQNYSNLADKVIKADKAETEERIDEISNTDHPCLSFDLSSLRESADEAE